MADVELVFKVDNVQALQKIREVERAALEANKAVTGKDQERLKFLDEEIPRLEKLKKSRAESFETDKLDAYTRKLQRLNDSIEDYEGETQKASKTTQSFGGIAQKASIVIAAVTAVIALFNKVIESTGRSADKAKVALAGLKGGFDALLRSLATGNLQNLGKTMAEAAEEGRRYKQTLFDIETANRALSVATEETNIAINKYNSILDSSIATDKEKKEAVLGIAEAEQKLLTARVNSAKFAFENEMTNLMQMTGLSREVIMSYIKQEQSVTDLISAGEKYNDLLKKRESLNKSLAASGGSQAIIEEMVLIDKQIEQQGMLGELGYKYLNLQIPSREKLNTLTQSYVALLQAENSELSEADAAASKFNKQNTETVKTLKTQAEEQKKLNQALTDFIVGLSLLQKYTPADVFEQVKTMVEDIIPTLKDYSELVPGIEPPDIYLTDEMIAQGRKRFKEAQDALAKERQKALKNELTDEEKRKLIYEGLITTFYNVSSTIADIYAREAEDAANYSAMLESRLQATQTTLSQEIELYKAGYASNVAAKRMEVEQLKQMQEEAYRKQQEIAKKQQALDTVMQVVNLLTASTEIFKSFSKIPVVGIPLAIGMIATMLGAYLSAKTKAREAVQLEEGGSGEYGVIHGKRHSEGGEPFGKNIEVEKGEAWGVLSRPATMKYGDMFHDIVSSFNRDRLPAFSPLVNVNMDTKTSNKKLDAVKNELTKVNKHFKREEYFVGNKRIIKSGNIVRIINR
jgi:uncharacterized protein YifE (UPF0438 family)